MTCKLHGRMLAVSWSLSVFGTAVLSVLITFCFMRRVCRRHHAGIHTESQPSLPAPSSLRVSGIRPEPIIDNPPVTTIVSAPDPPHEHSMIWTPQPQRFQPNEHRMLTDFESSYLLERIGDLRYAIMVFGTHVTWKPTTSLSAQEQTSHICRILKAHEYEHTEQDLVQLGLVLTRLSSAVSRESALTALLSWITITNISLKGSQRHTLLSPALLPLAATVDGLCFKPFGNWAWEKIRVYIAYLLSQPPNLPLPVLDHDLAQPIPNPAAADRLVMMVQDLLEPVLEIDRDRALGRLKTCFRIASRIGLGIQRDLRPWNWGFGPSGPKEPRLNELVKSVFRPVEPDTPIIILGPSGVDSFITKKQV